MASFFRFLARRPIGTSSFCRKEVEQISKEDVDKIKQKTRFSETSAFYGRGGSGNSGRRMADPFTDGDGAFAKPFYVGSYYDSYRFIGFRNLSLFGSVALLLTYVAWFRNLNDVDELWNYDMRLVYIAAKRRVLKDQIEQAKKAGRSTTDLETDLIDFEMQEEKIRNEEEKRLKKEKKMKTALST